MFRGNFSRRIDSGGRLHIPSQFIKELGAEAIIIQSLDGCLCLCPLTRWQRVKRDLDVCSNPKRIKITKRNGSWQVLVPLDLRRYTRLKSEVIVCGCNEYIELWDKNEWSGQEKQVEVDLIAVLGN